MLRVQHVVFWGYLDNDVSVVVTEFYGLVEPKEDSFPTSSPSFEVVKVLS
jgi:hypothetical protein